MRKITARAIVQPTVMMIVYVLVIFFLLVWKPGVAVEMAIIFGVVIFIPACSVTLGLLFTVFSTKVFKTSWKRGILTFIVGGFVLSEIMLILMQPYLSAIWYRHLDYKNAESRLLVEKSVVQKLQAKLPTDWRPDWGEYDATTHQYWFTVYEPSFFRGNIGHVVSYHADTDTISSMPTIDEIWKEAAQQKKLDPHDLSYLPRWMEQHQTIRFDTEHDKDCLVKLQDINGQIVIQSVRTPNAK